MADRTMEHLAVVNLFGLIVEFIMAEYAIRCNLLEEAKESGKEMVEALTIEVPIMKRQIITRQIQEIAVGADRIQ